MTRPTLQRLFSNPFGKWLPGVLVLGAIAMSAVSACSSSDTGCDDSKCATGNKCLALNGAVECRKVCSSNTDPATSCPFGYTCVNNTPSPFCVKDVGDLKKAEGQWGASCNPTGGKEGNPDCDSAQNFACYATSPTDGEAYCTRYDCTTDRECGAGFYCGTINVAPNAVKAKRTIGETQKACIRRSYCAPCVADLDCGGGEHCIADADGNSFCTPECGKTDNCPFESRCVDTGNGFKACYPRATRCAGPPGLCSPCRSDADCGPDGICVRGQYTSEQSCAIKSKKPCTNLSMSQAQGSDFDCPASTDTAANIKCFGGDILGEVPKDYCHGIYDHGGSPDLGCYTPAR